MRPALRAVVLALALHVALAALLAWHLGRRPLRIFVPEPAVPSGSIDVDLASVAWLAGADAPEPPAGPPLAPVAGAGDQAGHDDHHPLPGVDVDLPGTVAAAHGGGGPGGPESFLDRRDHEETRQQIWNDPDHSRTPRQATERGRQASPEALARAPARGFAAASERQTRRARAGAVDPALGERASESPGGGAGVPATQVTNAPWDERDPRFDRTGGGAPERRTGGVIAPGPRQALIDVGPTATDTARRGSPREPLAAAGASDELQTMPFDLGAARAGGTDTHGVAGAQAGDGPSASSTHRRGGTAASRAALAAGAGRIATQARRQDPYFRAMYERLDRLIEYPRELKLALEQGLVIVDFTLYADGRIGDVVVTRSSGFRAFDDAVTSALARAAPFGPVPRAILGGGALVRVNAPYTFANPLIR